MPALRCARRTLGLCLIMLLWLPTAQAAGNYDPSNPAARRQHKEQYGRADDEDPTADLVFEILVFLVIVLAAACIQYPQYTIPLIIVSLALWYHYENRDPASSSA